MNIELIKGPLPESDLRDISQLYGKYAPRYLSIEFCRKKFNDNLLGYSFHSVARAGGRIIGHHAIVPLYITHQNKEILAAKGEAFAVHPDYRKKSGETAKPLAFELVKQNLDFALKHRVQVITSIAAKDVGMLHRLSGSKPHVIKGSNWVLFHSNPCKNSKSIIKKTIGYVASTIQAAYLNTISFPFSHHNSIGLDNWEGYDPQLGDKWSFSPSKNMIHWYHEMGLKTCYYGNNPKNWISYDICDGSHRILVIVDWSSEIMEIKSLLSLLVNLIRESKKLNVERIQFTEWESTYKTEQFRKIAPFLGFLKRPSNINLFLTGDDEFYTERKNLHFHPLFYVTF